MQQHPRRPVLASRRGARTEATSITTDTIHEELQATRLRLAVVRLARRIRQEAGTGVTLSQLSALSTIGRAGPLRLGELAEHERISNPTVTRIVAGLEDAGYVERRADPADRRCVRVALTAEGRQVLEASRHRADAYVGTRLAQLTAQQRDHLESALPALERMLEVGE